MGEISEVPSAGADESLAESTTAGLFGALDKDHNGFITKEEFAPIEEACGVKFNMMDVNDDGQIDKSEFANFAKEFEKEHGEEIKRLQAYLKRLNTQASS